MSTALSQSSTVWNSDLGEFVSDAHSHLAAVLQDYKPTLSLVYIPKKDRDATDTKPWAILDSPANMPTHIIRYLSDVEMQNPSEILAWIFEGDLNKHRPDDIFARMETKRMAHELLNLKQQEEELAYHKDLIAFAVNTNKHSWKHNGKRYNG